MLIITDERLLSVKLFFQRWLIQEMGQVITLFWRKVQMIWRHIMPCHKWFRQLHITCIISFAGAYIEIWNAEFESSPLADNSAPRNLIVFVVFILQCLVFIESLSSYSLNSTFFLSILSLILFFSTPFLYDSELLCKFYCHLSLGFFHSPFCSIIYIYVEIFSWQRHIIQISTTTERGWIPVEYLFYDCGNWFLVYDDKLQPLSLNSMLWY